MSEPVEFYPNPVANRDTNSSSHANNGSFGPVFIVLAVIVVLSSVACVLGRLCSRRRLLAKEAQYHQPKANNKQSHVLGPKEWESRQKPSFNMRDGDIEFGFNDHKKIPSVKMAAKGGARGKPFNNGGGHKPDIRFSGNV